MTKAAPTQQGPRLRFAHEQIKRALTAIERASDGGRVDAWMRCLELEDRIDDLRDDLETVRQERDVLRRTLAGVAK